MMQMAMITMKQMMKKSIQLAGSSTALTSTSLLSSDRHIAWALLGLSLLVFHFVQGELDKLSGRLRQFCQ